MSDWSHGYNVTQGYTYGSYRELSPEWLDGCVRLAGYETPRRDAGGEAFRYCEFGSGQGVGLCFLASVYPQAQFVGIDFNPEHIAHARDLAQAAGLDNVLFVEGDFAEMASAWPADLGRFDYATMHGILSWIPPAVQQGLYRCLGASLAPGALAYASYNAMPGWAPTLPFQHMLRRLEQTSGTSGPKAITQGVEFFKTLLANGAAIGSSLPTLKTRVDKVLEQDPAYLVQEYLHDAWTIFWFSDVAREMASAKLQFVGTATVAESMLPASLPPALREQVLQYEDPILQQEIIDCMINQTFRRDIFCRGRRRILDPTKRNMPELDLYLLAAPEEEELEITTSFGKTKLKKSRYAPVLDALRTPMTLAALMARSDLGTDSRSALFDTVRLLLQGGQIGIGRTPGDMSKAVALNRVIARQAVSGAPYQQLAAPAIRSIIGARLLDLVLLHAWFDQPGATAEVLGAEFAATLERTGRQLKHEGQDLTGDALRARGVDHARQFLERVLPAWQRLGVVGA